MTFVDDLSKRYSITIKCGNCSCVNDIKIPKGIAIQDFIKQNKALCKNCGCVVQSKFQTDGGLNGNI